METLTDRNKKTSVRYLLYEHGEVVKVFQKVNEEFLLNEEKFNIELGIKNKK